MSDENRTLLLDILRPYRKAVSASTVKASVASAAAKLNFSDASVGEAFGKRKSGFEATTTPAKRTRSDSNSTGSAKAVSSPWETKRLKAELIEAKGQIARLESQIQHQHLIRKETEIYFDNEKKTFIEERRHREKAFTEIQERLQVVRERENEGQEKISEMIRQMNELKSKMANEKQAMQKEISELKTKLIDSSIINNGQLSEMKKDIDELTQGLEASQREAETYKEGHDRAVAEAEKATLLQVALDKQSFSLQQAEARLRELESDKESYKEWLEQAKVSQKRLASMPGLERELVNMRSELRSLRPVALQNQMLEEQVHVLNTRLSSLQPVHQNLVDIQSKYGDMDKEVEEWRAVGRQFEGETPRLLAALLERLQQRDLTLTTLKVEADSQLTKARDELLNAKHERDKAQTKLNDVQNIQKTQQSLIHRIQKKLLLVSRERDSYRHQLDCYERELTVSLAGEASAGGTGALLPARVEALEKSLQGYRDLVAKMEQDMLVCRADTTPALQEQLTRLKDEVENVKKDNTLLRARKDELEKQLESGALKGEYGAPKTKVVHLTQNPSAKAQEDFRMDLDKAYAELTQSCYKLLGFIIRTCKQFDNQEAMLALFKGILRSKLEYASDVWAPYHQKYIDMLEQIQKKFLRYVYMRKHGTYPRFMHHIDLLEETDSVSLETRRKASLAILSFKIWNNFIDSPFLLGCYDLYGPDHYSRSRHHDLFKVPNGRTDVLAKHSMTRGVVLLNEIANHLDIMELRRKIKRLEQNELEMTQKLSETLRDGFPVSCQEVEQLKSELESHKLKAQRVKETLMSSLQEYRNVCYILMGYKLDRTSPNNYRLLSIYADSPDEYLSFKLTPDGGIEMVQTEYSTQLKDLVELHLHHQKSFPVFVSALTFNLFNKTTMISESMTQ